MGQTIRYLVFKDRRHWCAVALELNIVETGLDPREVLFSLFESIQGSLVSAAKTGNRAILRQKPDPEYEKMWQSLEVARGGGKRKASVYTFGHRPLAVA